MHEQVKGDMICPTLIQESNALHLNLLLDVAIALRKGHKSPCTHTGNIIGQRCEEPKASDTLRTAHLTLIKCQFCLALTEASVYTGYKRDKIEMRGDRAEMSDFPLYLNTVAGGLDCRNQAIGGFSFVVKIYALPVVEIIGQFLYLLGRYGFDAQIGYCF